MKKLITYPIIVFILAMGVFGFPIPAAEFFGTVTINDTNATVSTPVTVYDNDSILCGTFAVSNEGYYGSLSCNGDDSETLGDEGAVIGDSILFYVNGTLAVTFGNTTWDSGIFSMVNLSAKNFAPTFDHNVTNVTIDEEENFHYDVNCTDLNTDDNVTYYENSTFFEINSTTGLFNWTPDDNDTINFTVELICGDDDINTTRLLDIIVNPVNDPPILDPIGPQISIENEPFFFDVNASDVDSTNLTFGSNSTFFTINETTGIISFTPTLLNVGNFTINITVFDGELYDFELVNFAVVRGAFCGDLLCAEDEECDVCAIDCGICPQQASQDTQSTVKGIQQFAASGGSSCEEKWECGEWTLCSLQGFQSRACADVNSCGTEEEKPLIEQTCIYTPTCFDGIKNGLETGIDCGGVCPACFVDLCFDGIQNQGELGVDCGGPCAPCADEREADLGLEQLGPLGKTFPWLLLLILAILLLLMIGSERFAVAKITKKEFDTYKEIMHYYRTIQKIIYFIIYLIGVAGLFYILHEFLFSDTEGQFLLFIIAYLATALLSAVLFRKYFFFIIKKSKQKKDVSAQARKLQLSMLEDNWLISLEEHITTVLSKLEYLSEVEEDFDYFKSRISYILKNRQDKNKPVIIEQEVREFITQLMSSEVLLTLTKEHEEFANLLESLKRLINPKDNTHTVLKLGHFIDSLRTISADKHLITILKAKPELITLYNQLVEMYEYYKESLDHKIELDKTFPDPEGEVVKRMDDLTGEEAKMGIITENAALASVYNDIVGLYNRYKKRDERRGEEKEQAMSN